VHRHLPSLAELKRAAQESLDWLWEWYWSQLDYAFGLAKPTGDDEEVEGTEAIREKLQALLKAYVKERKMEIKSRRKDPQAASNALSTFNLRYSPNNTSIPPARTQTILLRLLTTDKMILPTDKKLGSSMSGAFLIWDPLLLAFNNASILPVRSILAHFTAAMNAPPSSMLSTDMDPFKEAMHDWIIHILRAETWRASGIVEDTLVACFSEPTYWNLRVAETLLKDGNEVPNREAWGRVLEAAKNEDGDGDVEMGEVGGPVQEKVIKVKEKIRGPTKVVGLWRGGPIGEVKEGWEYDE
jgi:ribosomal biogenesis protein LAS1